MATVETSGDTDQQRRTPDCCCADGEWVVETLEDALDNFDEEFRAKLEVVGYTGREIVTVCSACGGPGEVLLH